MELKQFHRCEGCLYIILPGLLAMSTLLSGLFLWGLVKKHKKSKEKPSSSSKVEKASVFPTPTQENTFFPPDSWNVHVSDSAFDPQTDYAEVLYEAHKFMAAQQQVENQTNPQMSRTLSFKPEQQMTRSDHINVKSKSSWKFWQRAKKTNDGQYNLSPPPQQARPLKRSASGPVTSHAHAHAHSKPGRKGQGYSSGPLYTVGMPLEPANNRFSRSGTRSGSTTPVRGEQNESPYVLLKCSARRSYDPELLYTV
ncbi:uncharacterized protein LOC131063907 [Cryptomeria japonica]|uniref:uncharacterized protein LOC131063907 n=1 Tax=Cryptomeria japonica TaxID=3369 RepID=UPI0027DAA1B7|nr:uncharacterized protein LOC131063907 [Cryptomeria japonica]XP_057853869.2 uncharacterized protein LOC131063907 [Cryptomeria japonica]XP_057853872.2 uncharacterized protein LOC131063907 [Cryptomeria japonica]XP_057853876.2 uncharacterized protein LOC131063907 [Cryptomeria japonica]XP_057853882.2 uncharacterized protein LOC131063907 [Cryptomeria japonica]XP_059074447.1 uncharacterized protein LOC131063907 [Cryptomeria japonica]XP_059074448.1 uncharacterized protein LOC131063907 [Cryptomeria 